MAKLVADLELQAMARIGKLLSALDEAERQRVLAWVIAKHDAMPGPEPEKCRHPSFAEVPRPPA